MKAKHILLTTDLSEESRRAYGPTSKLARKLDSKVTLLHVVQDLKIPPHGAPLAPPMSAPETAEEVVDSRKLLQEEVAHLGEGVQVTTDVAVGEDLGRTIVEYGESHGADLIALSTHGHSGFKRLILGSVAESILRHSHIPVLCFPRTE